MQKRADVCAGNILRARSKVSSLEDTGAPQKEKFYQTKDRRLTYPLYPLILCLASYALVKLKTLYSSDIVSNVLRLLGFQ